MVWVCVGRELGNRQGGGKEKLKMVRNRLAAYAFFPPLKKEKKSLKSFKIWVCGGGAEASWQRKLVLKTTSDTGSFVLH